MTILSSRSISFLRIFCAAGALTCAPIVHGQSIITTVAGGGFVNNVPAVQSHLNNPQGVAVDSAGNVYIGDAGRILKIDHSSGNLSAVAGVGLIGTNTSDGPALTVRIAPAAMAVNSAGNLVFLDSSALRQLNVQAGTITTIAGEPGISADTGDGGAALNAQLNMPRQFCFDPAGNIFIVEQAGYVRRIDAQTNVITTVAGNGGFIFAGDNGPATAATLVQPAGIACDSSGNLYIADSGDLRIRKITASTQVITTIAGNGHTPTAGDGGNAGAATFTTVGELGIDTENNLYVIDGNRVRKIASSSGIITTVAGNGTAGLTGDGGSAAAAELNTPVALALDAGGDLFIADNANRRVRMVAASSGVISTIAGTSQNGDGGLAIGAVLTTPRALAVNSAGDLFIGGGSSIRKVAQSSGVISTFAGGGTSTADGIPATQAELSPLSLVFDSSGNLVVGELGLIRRIDTSGTITTIAGTGAAGFAGDGGPALQAQIGSVNAMAYDSSGNLFFADGGNKRLRRIDTGGVITTVAGNGDTIFTSLGATATQTAIGNISGVAVDASGNSYIGSLNTYLVLKVSPSGGINFEAGNGGCSYTGDGGPATFTYTSGLVAFAAVCQASTLALDGNGNLYVGDSNCYCVRRIASDTNIIQTVAGSGTQGYTGDGAAATLAQFNAISALAVHGNTLYIADSQTGVVRAVTPFDPPALPGTPSFSRILSAASFTSGAVAPGEIVAIFGNYLGTPTPGSLTLGSDGRVTTQIPNLNTQVFFDDAPAPLTYVSSGQINAVVPYSVANGLHSVRVQGPGGSFTSTDVSAIGSAPGIFPYAVVNQDGTLNLPSSPAPVGSYVVLYGTGLGPITPAETDGEVVPSTNIPTQVYPVQMVIGMNPLFETPLPMHVLYGGPAPGLVSGVCQINVVIPDGTTSGKNFAIITAGPGTSTPVPIYVQ